MSLQAAIPLMADTEAINGGLKFIHHQLLTFKATVYEGNMGAHRLAQIEPGHNTPCSKFYELKLHWFCSWLKPKYIEIIHCSTQKQKADFLNKALGPTAYKVFRLRFMGW